ncbi:MAG: NUDIX domain-containing protein [Deltaproteobacteria bacterium]|nr:NUDIX domain-containing protein [Deltaproteobacteria bacterium]
MPRQPFSPAGSRLRQAFPPRPGARRFFDETDLLADLRPSIPASLRILEITDAQDRPLMLMQPDAAMRQKLYRRMVCVALYGKGRLYVHKSAGQSADEPGRWDFCSGQVLAGEAREDAARRLILARTGLADPALTEILRRTADSGLPAHLVVFAARLPRGVLPDSRESMAVDADELEGLVAHSPEMFTPALIWAAGTGRLFS